MTPPPNRNEVATNTEILAAVCILAYKRLSEIDGEAKKKGGHVPPFVVRKLTSRRIGRHSVR